MRDHTVELDRSESPAAIRVAPVFNVAVPFIDRHLDDGRGAKAAIRTIDEEVSYAELAWYEVLGFCPEGQAGQLIDDGVTELGGEHA